MKELQNDQFRPVIFLAFANDRSVGGGYLRNLPEEARRLRKALDPAERAGLCEVVVLQNVMAADVLDTLQDARYRDRVGIFHYGGHAGGFGLLLESALGEPVVASAGGLAAFLGRRRGLKLVFLNGCSTEPQVFGLLEAGAPAVIATAHAIDDALATEFSARFYVALAAGATVQSGFHEAAAAVSLTATGPARDLGPSAAAPAPADQLPWHFHVGEGAELAADWSLPEAASNPLFGLPAPAARDLPENPYLEPLAWFGEEHAEVFCGRGAEIRELYERVTGAARPPILLLYGRSGVGKSSLLGAGLLPRICAAGSRGLFLRRDAGKGLLGTITGALGGPATGADLAALWRDAEAREGRPLLVILDQVEEALTHAAADKSAELDAFIEALRAAFAAKEGRPLGRLILGFRMEWLAVIEMRLAEALLPRAKMLIEPLDRRGIMEAVRGPGRLVNRAGRAVERPVLSERLAGRYELEIDDDLPGLIADDLLADRGALVGPTLQVLLSGMWDKARSAAGAPRRFDRAFYEGLRRRGVLLGDFLDQRLDELAASQPDAAREGLILDFLEFHTTSLGTAAERTPAQLEMAYRHIEETLRPMLESSKRLCLLADGYSTGQVGPAGTRLAHDTLAPLVRERYDRSDRLAQRARRILRNRLPGWDEGRVSSPMDRHDLNIVERAAPWMRAWSHDECRLIEASRLACSELEQDRLRLRAQGFLLALGQEPGPVGRVELDNLWELAGLGADDEAVRLWVIRLATGDRRRAVRFEPRLEPAVHAAIGLDLKRRRRLLDEVIVPQLRNPSIERETRWVCARVGLELEEDGAEFLALASAGLAAVAAAGDRPPDAQAVVLARRLGTAVADSIVEQLLASNAVSEPARNRQLFDWLTLLGARTSPAVAERAVTRVLATLAADAGAVDNGALLSCLQAFNAGLPPVDPGRCAGTVRRNSLAEAELAAESLIRQLAGAGPDDLCQLAEWLEALGPWMTDAAAAAARARAAPSTTQGAPGIVRLARSLGEIGPRLRVEDAEVAANRLVSVLGKLSDESALQTILRGLQAVAPRLAALGADKAAMRISSDLARSRIAAAIHALARGLAILAPHVAAGTAARLAATAAEYIVGAMSDANRPEDIGHLARALGNLATLLDQDMVESVLTGLAIARTPVERLRLASVLAALAPALPQQQTSRVAARIVERLLEPFARETRADDLRLSAASLAMVVRLLDGEPARRVGARLIDLMAAMRDGDALLSLADALGTIPGFLDAAAALELLKYPLSVGPVRASLLGSLARASGRDPGQGLWQFVEEASRLGVNSADFEPPPVRPTR
jgi:hypothetical protein